MEITLRRELVRAGRDLARQGMMAGASGNLSARTDDGRVLISPSGAAKGRLRAADLLVIDLEGSLLEGEGRPSTETHLHLAIYRRFPAVRAVVHAHPVKATALAVTHRPIPTDTLPEALFTLGSIPLIPYSPADATAPGESVAEALADGDGALLLNHGAVTIGTSVEAARIKMEVLEALAQTAILTHLIGGAVTLSRDEVERLKALWRSRRW